MTVQCNRCRYVFNEAPRKTKRFGENAFEWHCPKCNVHLVVYESMTDGRLRDSGSSRKSVHVERDWS